MRKLFYLGWVVVFLFVFSCADFKEGMKAAAVARDAVQASSYGLATGTENGKGYHKISLSGGPVLGDMAYEDFQVTSLAALAYYTNIPGDVLKDIDVIIIEAKRSEGTITKEYTIDELAKAKETVADARKIQELLNAGNIDDYLKRLPGAARDRVGSADTLNKPFASLKEQFGPVKDSYVSGFRFQKAMNNATGTEEEAAIIFITEKRNEEIELRFVLDSKPGISELYEWSADLVKRHNDNN